MAQDTLGNKSGRATFPPTAVLKQPSDFKRVFKKPKVSADSFFKVLATTGSGDRHRLGMAVSRKLDKRAVVRNRIKRLIRESFRQRFLTVQEPKPSADSGRKSSQERFVMDVVVLPRRESATICNKRLCTSLEKHWSRLEARVKESING